MTEPRKSIKFFAGVFPGIDRERTSPEINFRIISGSKMRKVQ
jgi:hypothetical protein